jgi:hypothetical protein
MGNVVYILKGNQNHWYGVPTEKLDEWLSNLVPGDLVVYPSKIKVVEAKLVDCEAQETISKDPVLEFDPDLFEEPEE